MNAPANINITASLKLPEHRSCYYGGAWHAPWDYLGGLLICREAGAVVVDTVGRELVVADPDVRRQLLAASTPALLEDLRRALPDPGRPA